MRLEVVVTLLLGAWRARVVQPQEQVGHLPWKSRFTADALYANTLSVCTWNKSRKLSQLPY